MAPPEDAPRRAVGDHACPDAGARVMVDRHQLQEIVRRARWIDRTVTTLLAALGVADPEEGRPEPR